MAYIQEAQSTPQTPTSTTTTNSVSGGSIGTGGGGASPDSEQNGLGTSNKVASATVSPVILLPSQRFCSFKLIKVVKYLRKMSKLCAEFFINKTTFHALHSVCTPTPMQHTHICNFFSRVAAHKFQSHVYFFSFSPVLLLCMLRSVVTAAADQVVVTQLRDGRWRQSTPFHAVQPLHTALQ